MISLLNGIDSTQGNVFVTNPDTGAFGAVCDDNWNMYSVSNFEVILCFVLLASNAFLRKALKLASFNFLWNIFLSFLTSSQFILNHGARFYKPTVLQYPPLPFAGLHCQVNLSVQLYLSFHSLIQMNYVCTKNDLNGGDLNPRPLGSALTTIPCLLHSIICFPDNKTIEVFKYEKTNKAQISLHSFSICKISEKWVGQFSWYFIFLNPYPLQDF